MADGPEFADEEIAQFVSGPAAAFAEMDVRAMRAGVAERARQFRQILGNPAHQHVAVQQVAVDQVPALRAGIDQGLYPPGDRRREGGQLLVGGQAGAPAMDRFAGVID